MVVLRPPGVGKALLRCVTCLEPFKKGRSRVGDIAIEAGLDLHRHRDVVRRLQEQVGFVFQFLNLFPHLTILENLTLGPVHVQKRDPAEAEQGSPRLVGAGGVGRQSRGAPHSLSGGKTAGWHCAGPGHAAPGRFF